MSSNKESPENTKNIDARVSSSKRRSFLSVRFQSHRAKNRGNLKNPIDSPQLELTTVSHITVEFIVRKRFY